MTRAADDCDVLIVGAGPAGAAAAHLLTAWGHSVVVLHRAAAGPSLAESLPPSIRKLLRLVGHLDAVDAAAFHPNDGNIADWAGSARETSSADPGFHVSRRAFDDVLRASARTAGARIVDGVVRSVDGDDPVRVSYTAADGSTRTLRAQWVLDCSGRAGVVARRGLRRPQAACRTLALVADWDCGDRPAPERTRTTIESYAGGWAWSVPLSDTRRQCTVMIDPSTRPLGAGSAGEQYAAEIGRASAMHARLGGARQVSAPWACDASLYDCTRAADGRVLLVGDAASFIDPLSSAGVKKALLSAWRAAVVTNTCLTRGAMAGAALDLHIARERQVFADCCRRSSRFFADAAAFHATPFWQSRADALARAAAGGGPAVDDEDLAQDRDVRTALERLQQAPRTRLRSARALRFEPAPSIEGREVVMRDALVVPGGRAPLQFAAGVDLTALARLATDAEDVPALITAYQTRVAPAPPTGVLAGLSLLVARHALVTVEDPRS